MDRIKDNISLDHMARLLVDVQQDSSGIVDSIISQHQRELLNLIFLGDAPNRNKVNVDFDTRGWCYHLVLNHLLVWIQVRVEGKEYYYSRHKVGTTAGVPISSLYFLDEFSSSWQKGNSNILAPPI